MNNKLIKCFHFGNLILIIFYLYPGSIFGYVFYNDPNIQPQITSNFIISSNHFIVFGLITILGILAYHNTKKINLVIKYLFFLSIFLEFFHIIIKNRAFEWSDLFGNIIGVIIIVIVYKIINKYAQNK